MRKPVAFVLFSLLTLAGSARSQNTSEKFAVFVVGMDTAAPVAQSLIKQLNASKPFVAVSKNDANKVAVLISCMPRKQTEPFVCMYVLQFSGATFKTFMGGGLFFSATADEVATNFLGSIAEDVVERFNDTNLDNLRQGLESCLLLTDSKCNVPDPLQKEFDAKELTLGQYLLKKHQQGKL